MAKHKEEKTNVMRLLDRRRVPYTPHLCAEADSPLGDREYGLHLARALGQDAARVYKTLVARGARGGPYVFCIPAAETLDLRKAARAVGEKSVELVAVKELLPLTGYIRGGCSPIGMKKPLPTWFHESIMSYETIYCSAGQRGLQFCIAPADLIRAAKGQLADLIDLRDPNSTNQ